MNDDDLKHLADRLRRCATVLETRGIHALDIASSWRGHTKAKSYDPAGRSGLRHDEFSETDPATGAELVHVVAVPHDPTGEADPTTVDQLRHPRLVASIGSLDVATARVTNLVLNTVPHGKARDKTPGDGWCSSCYRDGQYLEAEDVHRDGRVKHKGMCSWCAAFVRDYHRLPPLELLERRHEGRRITNADVVAALKPKPKKNRRKRAS